MTHLNKVSADFNDINKTKGFLNHDKMTFEFIGLDKEPVKLASIDKYLQVVEIIIQDAPKQQISQSILKIWIFFVP